MFLNQENEFGIYAVKFFIRGKPWLITVDDSLLVKYSSATNFELYFSKFNPRTYSFWPMLIEKAWAKVQGCYSNAQTGSSAMALSALTGVPVFTYATADYDNDLDFT
tara:strand:- start:937 stop:1257 length:321 start_codon:yes stop_codon:yes gene_type:complete